MLWKSAAYTQASGSVGGMTWSRNRYGAYCRARVNPVNPASDQQETARQHFTTAVDAWINLLTEANRQTWITYGLNTTWMNKLHDVTYLTGQAEWIRVATASLRGQGALPTSLNAPLVFNRGTPGFLTIDSLSAATRTLTLNIDGAPQWAGDDDSLLLVQAGLPQNPSRNGYFGPWRQVGVIPGNTTLPITTGTIVVAAATLFTPQLNKKQWFRWRVLMGDNRLSTQFDESVITTA